MAPARDVKQTLIERFALNQNLQRALRTSLAFSASLLVCQGLHAPADGVLIAMTAQFIALQDIRGAYPMRLAILTTMTLVAAGSVLLGALVGGNALAATLAMGSVALLGGFWRHLSGDYGPPLSIASTLLFLLGLAQPGGFADALHLSQLALIGGGVAAVLQIAFWLFRPQHALRYAVAETWIATSDLALAMQLETPADTRAAAIARCERELRVTLDRTFVILGAAEGLRQAVLLDYLEEMRRQAVHFSMRLIALNAAMNPMLSHSDFFAQRTEIASFLNAVANAARSVAVTLIMRREENFGATQVRLQMCKHLSRVLDESMRALPANPDVEQVRAVLQQFAGNLTKIETDIADAAKRVGVSSSLPRRLPELSLYSGRALAAWMNPGSRFDPVLVRHGLRVSLLSMIAVAIYEIGHVPRGYWIAFTIAVVLQPDYGSTRQRALQRIGGTLAGTMLGSALLYIRMSLPVLDALAAVMSFGFGYFVRRSYAIAIFAVTLLLVVISETVTEVRLDFTGARLFSNVLGGAMALIGARLLWPSWENKNFAALLARAVRGNADYLAAISDWIAQPESGEADAMLARRRAENANRFAAASLERLSHEPHRQINLESIAAVVNYNEQLTRAFVLLALHLQDDMREVAGFDRALRCLSKMLREFAAAVERGENTPLAASAAADLDRIHVQLSEQRRPVEATARGADLARVQIGKSVMEVRAMLLAWASPGVAAPSVAPPSTA